MQTWLHKYKEDPAYCGEPSSIHTSRPLHLEKKPRKWGKKQPATLNWLKTIKMEPKVHLGKEVAFRHQNTAIADNLSPVIWDNCLLGGTNTGRNQLHTSVSEVHWGPFPCTFQPSKEVFSTGSFFSSSRTGVQHLREDSLAWESKDEWPHFWDANVPEM